MKAILLLLGSVPSNRRRDTSRTRVPTKAMAQPSETAQAAVALLVAGAWEPAALEAALDAVIQGGPAHVAAFGHAFGPRHLMKALGRGLLSDRAEEQADELLAASDGGGLTSEVAFDTVHHEQLYPDTFVDLTTTVGLQVPDDAERVPLHVMDGKAAFVPAHCEVAYADPHTDAPSEDAVLRLRSSSRRQRLGSEIECKVWPSAIILGRWLWRHPRLVRGRCVLELGCGVAACGLVAAKCGAQTVALTDINATALALARQNAEANGVDSSTVVAHLDWARPPIEAAASEDGAPAPPSEEEGVDPLLRRQFDVVLAADVVNDVGLSEMLFRVIELYLAPHGLFVMVCPKAQHRHCVDRIRALLLETPLLHASVGDVPAWLRDGLEEAVVVHHELIVVQWRR